MRLKNYVKSSLSLLLLTSIVFLTACDEGQVRQLGGKVGARGQDVGNAAAAVIKDLAALEQVDYEQRLRVAILSRPAGALQTLPTIQRNRLDRDQMNNRIKLYKQLAKAYAALQTLSQTAFADQYAEAANELNGSIQAIKQIPNPPPGIANLVMGLGGIAVEKKQARDIKKHSVTMARLVRAYKGLWAADRPVWDRYLQRISEAYITNLNRIPPDRFDEDQLRQVVNLPYAKPYLASMYKAQEAARVNALIAETQDDLDAVDAAFAQLEKAHKELTEQEPSYTDVIASLDRIVVLLQGLT